MEVTVKQLTQNSKVLFPQTSAEAVLVKKGNTVVTLDTALQYKLESIETPSNSGLTASQTGQSVVIQHSNPVIEPNTVPEPLLVQHDSRGHIINKLPMGKFTITVGGQNIVETNGSEDENLTFGDDFTTDGVNVKLKWNNI